MKKLLLTLLGAAALCGLSPHPLIAQETQPTRKKTVTFQGWKADNPEFRYSRQISAAATNYNTATKINSGSTALNAFKARYAISDLETRPQTELPESALAWGNKAYGQGQFNWDMFQIEFDYTNAAYSYYNQNSTTSQQACWGGTIPSPLNQTTWKYTTELNPESGLLSIYPGIDMKFSIPGKRIKKVIIHTGLPTTHTSGQKSFNAYKLKSNLRAVDKLGTISTTTASAKARLEFVDNEGTADVVLTSTELFGTEESLFLKVNQYDGMKYHPQLNTLYYPIPLITEATSTNTKPVAASSRPTDAAYQKSMTMQIKSIDVEYYDATPFSTNLNFSKTTGDKILYKNQDSGEWEEKTTSFTLANANAKETEYVKIGDAIFEIKKESTTGTNILKIDPTNGKGLGLFIGTKFRVYPDPEKYKMDDGSGAKTYQVNLICSGLSLQKYMYSKHSSMNMNACNAAATTKFDGVLTFPSVDTNNASMMAMSESGMSSDIDNWITLSKTGVTAAQIYRVESTSLSPNYTNGFNGTDPIALVDGVKIVFSSSAPNPPASPVLTTDLDKTAFANNCWHSVSPITITATPQTDDYDNHTIQYVGSDKELTDDEIDWTKAQVYDEPIKATESKYYYFRIGSEFKDKTYYSPTESIRTSILTPTYIASLVDLHKAENDGKLVLLQMPLMVRGNCKMNVQGASEPNKFTNVVYARDANGIAVKLISRRDASSDDDFPSSLSYDNPTIDRIYLVPINTVVGKYHYNNGINPEIIIRDLTSDPADDYYAYQGKESAVQVNRSGGTSVITEYEGISFANGKATKLATDEEYTDITDPHSLLGKIVILRGLANWNATENTFELSESADKKTIKIRSGATVEGSLSAGSGHTSTAWNPTLTGLSSDKRYSVIAAIEYDPKANDGEGEYYLAPYSFLENFAIPTLQIPEADKDKFVTKTDDKGNITEIEYTEEVTSGKIYLTLDLVRPAGVNFSSLILKDEEGKTIQDQYYNALTSYKFEIPTSKLTFDEESGTAVIYASAYSKGNYNVNNSGEKLKITIRDAVQTGPEVLSIEEFRTKMQNGELSADKPVYVRFNGRFAVVACNGNVLQLRDVDKDLPLNPANASDTVTVFKDSYILVHDNNEWEYTYTKDTYGKVTRTGFPVTYSVYRGNNLWETYAKGLAIGEEIREFIGKVTIDKAGNFDVDLTDLGNFFRASALFEHRSDNPYVGEVSVPGYQQGTPRFFPYMSATDEQGNLVMREENCVNRPVEVALSDFEEHPESHPDNIELSDALLDAEMKVMKVQVEQAADDYTALFTADGVALLWDMFATDQVPSEPSTAALADEPDGTTGDDTPAEPAKSVKQQLADYMEAGTEHFNVTGILRKHTDGKYALQVEKIEPTPVDKPARFFADGEEIEGDSYEFVKRVDLTTDTPEGAVIKMTVGDKEQEAYDPEKLKGIDSDTKVVIKRSTPGVLDGNPTVITLTKLSSDVNTLAEMAEGGNANNLYHFRKYLKVVAAAKGKMMTIDAEGNIAVVAAAPAEAAEDKYLNDIVLVRNGKHAASIHEVDADAKLLDEADSYAISTPVPVRTTAIDEAAHTGKAVTLFGADVADGKAIENEGKGNAYAIDPTFADIPEGDSEAWSLTGYILPGADGKPVVYLTASKAVDRVALPVITPAETAFLDQTTFTIDCATAGAAIEYSLDGGKTWTAYNGYPVKVEATCEIIARATATDMLPSHEAKASVVREYLSGEVTITVDEQNGKTVITIAGPGKIYYSLDGAADKLYDGAITIANDTQTELSGIIRAYAVEDGKRPGAAKEASYKVSGISGIGADGEADGVRVEGNTITVPEGAQTFDIAGRRVNPQGLSRGIYIVRLASGKAVKVVIR